MTILFYLKIRKGTVAFSDISSSYSGSLVEGYVNNYKFEIEKMGVKVEEARLIRKEELIDEKIGCSEIDFSCIDAPEWIYFTSYWTETPFSNEKVWRVNNKGEFGDYQHFNYNALGVRPVIVVSKFLF